MRRWLLALLCASVLLPAARRWRAPVVVKPNILIISVCSLRSGNLGPYGSRRQTTPALDRFARSAFRMDNAFTDRGWSNPMGFLVGLDEAFLRRTGYEAIGAKLTAEQLHAAGFDDTHHPDSFYFQLPNVLYRFRDENFLQDLSRLRAVISTPRSRPFLLHVHSKFLHLPFSLPLAGPAHSFLSPDSARRYRELMEHPERYPASFPAMLFAGLQERNPGFVESFEPVRKAIRAGDFALNGGRTGWMSWIQDPKLAAAWAGSPAYRRELRMIEELYDTRLRFHDDALAPLLSLYELPRLTENTVVIFSGDHGELFGEHGQYGHGQGVYDSDLRFPLLIHFPGMNRAVPVGRQVFQGFLGNLVPALMEGRVNGENFPRFLEGQRENDLIVSRNCSSTRIGIRERNRWKLVLNLVDGSRQLFDLEADPAEARNALAAHPDVAARLEESWILRGENREAPPRRSQGCEP